MLLAVAKVEAVPLGPVEVETGLRLADAVKPPGGENSTLRFGTPIVGGVEHLQGERVRECVDTAVVCALAGGDDSVARRAGGRLQDGDVVEVGDGGDDVGARVLVEVGAGERVVGRRVAVRLRELEGVVGELGVERRAGGCVETAVAVEVGHEQARGELPMAIGAWNEPSPLPFAQ